MILTPIDTQETYIEQLYNCRIDRRRCKPYSIPYTTFDGITFYAEFDSVNIPNLVQFFIYCSCDTSQQIAIGPKDYVIGTRPNGRKYLIFTLDDPDPALLPCECFSIYINIPDVGAWSSEKFCFERCDDVIKIESCYTVSTGDNSDCNGTYYGFTAGDYLGNSSLSYNHLMYIRKSTLKGNIKSVTYTESEILNKKSKVLVKDHKTFNIAEELPKFRADEIQAILTVGSLLYDGVNYIVQSATFESIIDCCETFKVSGVFGSNCELPISCNTICASCDIGLITVDDYTDTQSTGKLVTIGNAVLPLSDYEYTTDGGVTWNPITSNPFQIPYTGGGEVWNLIVRRDCGDGSYAMSQTFIIQTPNQINTQGFCVELNKVRVGNSNFGFEGIIKDSNNVATPAVSALTMDLNIYDSSTNTVITTLTLSWVIGSTTSNVQGNYSNLNYQPCLPSPFAPTGTLTDPYYCNLQSCPCSECVRMDYITNTPNVLLTFEDCNGLKVAPTDIHINWSSTFGTFTATILAGNTSTTNTSDGSFAFINFVIEGYPNCP